ncbi:MAG: MFS transporter [Gammaproteobacteria bacterium]|nr:MFS transporter [Gammaproteobacteria bacterium]
MTTPSSRIVTKQPQGIYYLALVCLWERFSYYGLHALLILYIAKTFGITDTETYAIYGAYGALVYTTPVLGGYLADRFIGCYHAMIIGALFIALGHFIVAIPSLVHQYFYLGLTCIIIGTGLFRPNLASVTGFLYQKNDLRRDGGFALVYIGGNLGTVIAPILSAYIALRFSWLLAFALAGIGMLVGLAVFISARKNWDNKAFTPAARKIRQHNKCNLLWFIGIIAILLWIVNFSMNHIQLVSILLYAMGLFTFSLLLFLTFKNQGDERRAMLLVIILTIFYVVFMALLQQSGGMLNLFTDRYINRDWLQWTIPTGMFQSVEPLFVVLLGPLYNLLWQRLSTKKITISYPIKFVLGLFIMGLAFLLLIVAMQFIGTNNQIDMWWINASYFLQAASELFIGPIGLSMIAALIPQRFIGLFMGAWVLASAFANFLAAKIGALTSPTHMVLTTLAKADALNAYTTTFYYLTGLALFAVVLLILLIPLLKKYA